MLPILKLEITSDVLIDAADYAEKSADFTANIADFKTSKDYQRYKQRFYGQCVQRLYASFLKKNGVDGIFKDGTNWMQSDLFDLKIKGHIFDVKGSIHENAPMQIPEYQNYNDSKFYLYGTINFLERYWLPHGFISKRMALDNSVYIKRGDPVPHWNNRKNAINSYFLNKNSPGWISWIHITDNALKAEYTKEEDQKLLKEVLKTMAEKGKQGRLF